MTVNYIHPFIETYLLRLLTVCLAGINQLQNSMGTALEGSMGLGNPLPVYIHLQLISYEHKRLYTYVNMHHDACTLVQCISCRAAFKLPLYYSMNILHNSTSTYSPYIMIHTRDTMQCLYNFRPALEVAITER